MSELLGCTDPPPVPEDNTAGRSPRQNARYSKHYEKAEPQPSRPPPPREVERQVARKCNGQGKPSRRCSKREQRVYPKPRAARTEADRKCRSRNEAKSRKCVADGQAARKHELKEARTRQEGAERDAHDSKERRSRKALHVLEMCAVQPNA